MSERKRRGELITILNQTVESVTSARKQTNEAIKKIKDLAASVGLEVKIKETR